MNKKKQWAHDTNVVIKAQLDEAQIVKKEEDKERKRSLDQVNVDIRKYNESEVRRVQDKLVNQQKLAEVYNKEIEKRKKK